MPTNHIPLSGLRFQAPVKKWLVERYGEQEAEGIWTEATRA